MESKQNKMQSKLSKKYILQHVEDVEVFKSYLNISESNIRGKGGRGNIKSVFSDKDNSPSMSVYIGQKGDCRYKCHQTDKKGDFIQLVRDMKNISFVDAMKDICNTFNIPVPSYNPESSTNTIISSRKEWIPETIDFSNTAIEFLESKGISPKVAEKYNMQQLSILKYKGEGKDKFAKYDYINNLEQIAFQYKIGSRYKLYVPKQENKKGEITKQKYFLKTQNQDDVFGWEQLPKQGDTVLICEGETDVLCAATHKYNAICFQSANTFPTNLDQVIRELKKRFFNIVVCYDSDDTGRKFSKELAYQYNLVRIEIPEPCNDICDYLVGDDGEFQEIINDAITEYKAENNINLSEKGCSYFVYDYKLERRVKISDFTISSQALIIGDQSSSRIISIKTRRGETKPFRVSTDDFVSTANFKKLTLSKCNEIFWGSSLDLANISRKVFDLCPVVEEITGIGYNEKIDSYIFPNGILNRKGDMNKINDLGVFKNIYIPSAANENKNNPNFKDQLNYSFRNGSDMDFYKWTHNVNILVGSNHTLFFAAMLVSSTIFHYVSKRNNNFPILNLRGQKGSGKTASALFGLGLFTNQPKEVNIKETSRIGFIRLFSQTPNIPIILDEFKNSIGSKKIEALKGIYNLTGRITGAMTNDNSIKRMSILSPCILAGQETIDDEALLSRVITLFFPLRQFSKLQIKTFKKLELEQEKGFGNILIELVKHQEYMIEHFEKRYYDLIEHYSNECTEKGINVQTRLIKNYAAYLAPLEIAIENSLSMDFESMFKELQMPKKELTIGDKIECIRHLAIHNLREQAKDEAQADEVNVLLELINSLQDVSNPDLGIRVGFDYDFNFSLNEFYFTGNVLDKARIYYRNSNNEDFTNKKSLINYLEHSRYYKKYDRKTMKVGNSKKQKRVYILKLDLIRDIISLPVNEEEEDDFHNN